MRKVGFIYLVVVLFLLSVVVLASNDFYYQESPFEEAEHQFRRFCCFGSLLLPIAGLSALIGKKIVS